MVSGVPYKLLSEPVVLHGSNIGLQLPCHGSVMISCRSSEIRRHHHCLVKCKLKNRENSKEKSKRQAKGSEVKLPHKDIPKTADFGNVLSHSVAPSALEMDSMDEYEAEFDADDDDDLSHCKGLILDMAYRPVNVVTWKRALCLDILEKADVLEYYDEVIYSPNQMFAIPAVLKVNSFLHAPKHKEMKLTLNRKNIFLRDKHKCQYCNGDNNLTIDHVYAVSKGGGWTWDNLVTACSACNLKKASKTLEEAHMTLMKIPKEPKALDSFNVPPNFKTFRALKNQNRTPLEWVAYLPRRYPLF